MYPDWASFIADHPTGIDGEAWLIGNATSNTIYLWDTPTTYWKDIGPIKGPTGQKGEIGATGLQGNTGTTGPTGPQGIQGAQ
jgi:hypothetical protein